MTRDIHSIDTLKPGTTIALAGSGGLDSCTIASWLTDHKIRVVCLTADLGQTDEQNIGDIEARMRASGAIDFHLLPLQAELAEAGLLAVQADAQYEDGYWNTTALARHVISYGLAQKLPQLKLGILTHGSTGRGNDQFRFQVCMNQLSPNVQIYAPWRDQSFLNQFRGRSEMIDYCQSRDLPIRASSASPYSTDANLLGLTHEAGRLEALSTPARFVVPEMASWPQEAQDKSEDFEVRFEKGRPVAVNGEAVSVLDAFLQANHAGSRNGIGMVHIVENRLVGLKSRGVYEQPGIAILGKCFELLRQLVLDKSARVLFAALSDTLATQIYMGNWFGLASTMAQRAVSEMAMLCTGTVSVTLYKGNIISQGINDVVHGLYREDHVSMEAVGAFDHTDAAGLMRILSLAARTAAEARQVSARRFVVNDESRLPECSN